MPLILNKVYDVNKTRTILSEAQWWIKRFPTFNEYELRDGIANISGGTEEFKETTIHWVLWNYQHRLGIKYAGYKVWHRVK